MAKILKWIGIIVILIFVVVLIIYLKGSSHLNSTWEVTTSITSVPSDSAILARGEHLAKINGCMDCHKSDFSGQIFVDAPPFLAVASNLTSGKGGVAKTYDDTAWDRAIRHGVRSDGIGMIVMPSKAYNNMSDEDAQAIIAYLKSLPPVDNDLPRSEFRFLGKILAGLGQLNLADHVVSGIANTGAPPVDSTAVYGKYLANITCAYCHGKDFSGGPGMEPGTTVPGLQTAMTWGFDGFTKLMRTGERPDGTGVDPDLMPYRSFQHYTDTELKALYAYLQNYK
jgi:cytochrome c553